ncbi:THAP domain-containing protein 3 [Harpegnathos saltator]|uniref:THAP domain-containing protein 3 n=1 Tax=Harpegnathos saltator TaxID=610380 RepID=UPI000DBEDAED|nr:THAP domain-containing protein 3 [Harpegnathos saltator]
MPSTCCIVNCNNTSKKGYHLFKFPIKRPEIFKKWICAIGGNFTPKKHHVICSAHFLPKDIMEKADISSVLLKNLAVPSIALRAPACDTVPAVECNSDPLVQPVTSSMMECDTIPAIEYLTLRMYSLTKRTKDRNPASNRHKFTKLILFNNT